MSTYLQQLLAKANGEKPAVRPHLRTRFEPTPEEAAAVPSMPQPPPTERSEAAQGAPAEPEPPAQRSAHQTPKHATPPSALLPIAEPDTPLLPLVRAELAAEPSPRAIRMKAEMPQSLEEPAPGSKPVEPTPPMAKQRSTPQPTPHEALRSVDQHLPKAIPQTPPTTRAVRSTQKPAPAPTPLESKTPEAIAQDPPVIRVQIGRVEVRANFAAAPEPRRARPRLEPQLDLETYLKQRNRGAR